MMIKQHFLVGIVVILATIVGWLSFTEVRRKDALISQQISSNAPQALATPELSDADTQLKASTAPAALASEKTPGLTVPTSGDTLASHEAPQATAEESEALPEPPLAETTAAPSAACSSFDEAGLLAAFDGALAAFLAGASAAYPEYGNVQYQLLSKSAAITEEQGIVTTSYSGTAQELATGEALSASGIITATFSWDGCNWQLLDYSF